MMNKIIAIAIDEYSDLTIKNLQNCSKDINLLIGTLSSLYEFDSIELFTKPEQTTLSFLYAKLYDEFINSLESDNILVLYAGHGILNSILGTTYWLCSDSKKSQVTTWFNLNDLLKFFKVSPAKHIAIILDCCFSGAIFALNRGGGTSAFEGKTSRQALTSGGLEEVSDVSPFNSILIDVLKENRSDLFSFNQLCETTILKFDKNIKQTPEFGSLIDSGDEGGMYFFKRKLKNSDLVKSIHIPLEINQTYNLVSGFEIPFFNENNYFNSNYVNVFVQQLGYSIVNDIRVFLSEFEGHPILRNSENAFYLQVGYSIHTLNENFLSITIERSNYFGGAHPTHHIYSLNFAFKPERKISLYDILDYRDYSNLEVFLINMIEQYAEEECREILKEHSTNEYFSQLDFHFNETYFTIEFINLIPYAMIPCGSLKIPIDEIKFKI